MSQPDSTQFAYPAYWDGDLSSCSWSRGDCDTTSLPLQGECISLTCASIEVVCPPPGVPLCPQPPVESERLLFCDFIPNHTGADGNPDFKRYYQHICNPILKPQPQLLTLLVCEVEPLASGDFSCYFTQRTPDGELAGVVLALECSTGSCLYGAPVPIDVPYAATAWWTVSALGAGRNALLTRRAQGVRLTVLAMALVSLLVVGGTLSWLMIEREPPPSAIDPGWLLSPTDIAANDEEFDEELKGLRDEQPYPELQPLLATPAANVPAQAERRSEEDDDEEALLAAAPLLGPALQPLLATPVAAHPALLEWRCVECWVLPGRLSRLPARKLLDGVSGRAGGGLSALLGPSGCGKTTLLELLAGRKGACYLVRGALRLNGAPTSPAQVQLASAYVPQEDVLPGTSTVWEHLAFHAALRLPPSVPAAERALRVQQTLSALGLARLAGARIGDAFQRGLSGGERRRVSIAAELLARPAMLFADEPTRCVLYAPAGTSLAPR